MSEKNWMLPPEREAQKRGITACLGIACAVVTVLVFSLLFFTRITLTVQSLLSLSVGFVLLFFSSYVMYASLFETGKDKGEKEEEVRALREKSKALLARYEKEGDPRSLLEFCEAQTEREREEARRFVLCRYSLTEEQAQALEKKPRPTLREKKQRLALAAAKRVRITSAMLLLGRRSGRYVAPLSHSPERMRRRRTALYTLFAAVTAAFSVSLVFEVLLSPDPGTIAVYLLKLFALFSGGVRGFRAGYAHATEDVPAYQKEQSYFLEEYFRAHTNMPEMQTKSLH